jgi:hypothetical protein
MPLFALGLSLLGSIKRAKGVISLDAAVGEVLGIARSSFSNNAEPTPPALFGLNCGLNKAGCRWLSVAVTGSGFLKNLNSDKHLQRSVDFSGSPRKLDVERAIGTLPDTQPVD